MGMAPYGTGRYQDKIWKLVRVSGDGALELDLDYFSYHELLSGRSARNPQTSLGSRARHPAGAGARPVLR